MTWEYQIQNNGDSMEIFDHTGTSIQTVQNDGSGFTIPTDVFDAMITEFNNALSTGKQSRALAIARDAAFEQIEEK